FPKEFSSMVHLALENKFDEARTIHYKLLEIIQNLFVEGNPAGIKEVLSHLDICENYMRLPLVPVSQSTSEKLRRLMIDEELTNYL
ncbi:MAG: dihydrodipicolinate synthase family protein, partial [Flavobacteriales bacterium]